MALEGYVLYEKVMKVFIFGKRHLWWLRATLTAYGSAALIVGATAATAAVNGDKAYGRHEL